MKRLIAPAAGLVAVLGLTSVALGAEVEFCVKKEVLPFAKPWINPQLRTTCPGKGCVSLGKTYLTPKGDWLCAQRKVDELEGWCFWNPERTRLLVGRVDDETVYFE